MVHAAAGKSLGREIKIIKEEGGGNGPNFADGVLALGATVDLFGTLGDPIHAAFAGIALRCRTCTAMGNGFGRTLALEFGDGKLMLNETSRLGGLDESVMHRLIDAGRYADVCAKADVIGLCNWSKYPHMTGCWRVVQERVLSGLRHRPLVLVDLADPGGRDVGDLREALGVVGQMQSGTGGGTGGGRVVVGANLHEAGLIAGALGVGVPSDEAGSMQSAAAGICERMGVEMVVIHSQRRAAGAWRGAGIPGGTVCVEGAYTASPVRTTGVGDRFNAGMMYALANGNEPAVSIAMGCAAGGYFVRHGNAGGLDGILEWVGQLGGA